MDCPIDAYDLWKHNEEEAERWLESRPVCSICEEHIQDEKAYNIDGTIICQHCLETHFQFYVEDYAG